MSEGPRGVWLGASALLGRAVRVSEPYPHVHAKRTPQGYPMGAKACAACGEANAPAIPDLGEGFEGLHDCEPAGRGTEGDEWTCSACGQLWRRELKTKFGMTTSTWRWA